MSQGYDYASVRTSAANALLSHPDFDTRLRPALDLMCAAIAAGEPVRPQLAEPDRLARQMYQGNPFCAELFVWGCSRLGLQQRRIRPQE